MADSAGRERDSERERERGEMGITGYRPLYALRAKCFRARKSYLAAVAVLMQIPEAASSGMDLSSYIGPHVIYDATCSHGNSQ